jgi:hypothetical protein
MATKRNYKQEYANYQGKPEQIKNRAARNAARREYEKKNGNLPRNVDVDHKKPIAKGGGNGLGNLRAQTQKANRSFPRTRNAKMK